MGRTPTLSEDGAAWWRGEISREEAERRSMARTEEEGQRTPEEEEAYHLAEAERFRNAPHASANTPPNPFGSM